MSSEQEQLSSGTSNQKAKIVRVRTPNITSRGAQTRLGGGGGNGGGASPCINYNTLNNSVWSPQLQVSGIGTSNGPALAAFNSMLYMAWKGTAGDTSIWYSPFNGTSWAAQQQVPGVGTSGGPALAVFNSNLYMAWQGAPGDLSIWYSSFNGTSWAAQQQVPGVNTSGGPALSLFNGELYMAWQGAETAPGIWYSSFNGTSWAAQQQIPGVGTSSGPALALFNGKLYMAWKGADADTRIWYSSFNGASWAAQQQVSGVGTSNSPALAAFNNQLYMSWIGAPGDPRIWYSIYDGTNWAAQQQIPDVGASNGPAFALFNGTLYMAWESGGSDPSTNCCGVAQSVKLTVGGGAVLSDPDIYLIFWDSAWEDKTAPIPPTIVEAQFERMLYGPYNLGLSQYNNAGYGSIDGVVYFNNDFSGLDFTASGSIPTYSVIPADQADLCNQVSAVAGFQASDVVNVILAAIVQGLVPAPSPTISLKGQTIPVQQIGMVPPVGTNPLIYVVLPPPGTPFLIASTNCPGKFCESGYVGENFGASPEFDVEFEGSTVLTTLGLNAIFVSCSDLPTLTHYFSHEYTESVVGADASFNSTDPTAVSPPSATNGSAQISDVCQGYAPVLYGVTVQSYWSATDNACIVPVYAWNVMTPAVNPTSIAAAADGSGATHLFAVVEDGLQVYTMPAVAAKTEWNAVQALGPPTGSLITQAPPAVGSNPGGRLEVFASDGLSIFHIWQDPTGGAWSAWESLGRPSPSGSLVGAPVVVTDATGRLNVFACIENTAVYVNTQTQPGQGPWSGWTALPTLPAYADAAPGVVLDGKGNLAVFVQGASSIYVLRQTLGSWTGNWLNLGSPSTVLAPLAPVAALDVLGLVEVFATSDGAIARIQEDHQSASGWSSWSLWPRPVLTSGIASAPAVIRNKDNSLEVFAISADGFLWHVRQTIINLPTLVGGTQVSWQGWTCLGAQVYNQNLAPGSWAPPAVVVGADGMADAYAITGFVPGTTLYAVAHIWQAGNGEEWAWMAMNSGCY